MTKNKRIIGLILIGIATGAGMGHGAAAWPQDRKAGYCQILDDTSDPLYRVRLGYVSESRFENSGKSASLELDADWEVAYFRDVLWGNLDMSLRLDTLMFLDSADINLPDLVTAAAFDAGWTFRSGGALGVQARVMPGVYSDLESLDGEAVAMPFSLAAIHAFNPSLSGMLGAEIRPGFERSVMPLVGVVWEIADNLRLDARLPESRFEYFITPDWSTYLGFAWRNTTFDLDDEHDAITVEDFEFGGGVTLRASDQVDFIAELGTRFSRSVEYDKVARNEESEIDVENAVFVRVGLGGPF